MDEQKQDIIIVGGGPAGLSAALVLGRAMRRVLVIDEGKPRNRASRAVHGFLSRDGTSPEELRRIARDQLRPYQSVRFLDDRVESAEREGEAFVVRTGKGDVYRARKMILATGLVDVLPEVQGLPELFGQSVFNCPYCDGYELRGCPIAVYGQCDQRGAEYALELLPWTRDIVLCTDGAPELTAAMRERLARNGVAVRDERIERLEAREGVLTRILFTSGASLPRRAMFVNTPHREASDLARRLGADGWSEENCRVSKHGRTNVAGLFVIGDASRDVLQVAVAVSEGCEAAMTAHTELLREELR
jgi:thioredoxin reductase